MYFVDKHYKTQFSRKAYKAINRTQQKGVLYTVKMFKTFVN